MTTTDNQVIIETSDGEYFHGYKETTDGTAAECQIRDPAGNLTSVGDLLLGKTITRIAVQCSTGSILTELYLTKGGSKLWDYYGGERLATTQQYNLDARGISFPVSDKNIKLYLKTAD